MTTLKSSRLLSFLKPHGLFVLFLCVLLLFGIKSYGDYNITYDDIYQRHHTMVLYNSLFLQDQTYITSSVDTTKLPHVTNYGANYGAFIQLPTIFWEHIHDFELSVYDAIQARHFYVFLWFIIAVFFFYRLCLRLTKHTYLSLLGSVMLTLSPRILAHANFNIKDLMCLSLFAISMYYGICFIEKQSWKNTLLFLLFSGLCTTSRVVGGELIVACLLVCFFKSIHDKTHKRFIIIGGSICIAFLLIFVAMTPQAWKDPVQMVLKILKTFSNYTTWQGNVLYMGQYINGQNLPWHYLFIWILISVPLVYQILYIGGIASYLVAFRKGIKHCVEKPLFWAETFTLLLIVIPFAYVLLFRPTLYNGWRHFYFIYPALIMWSVFAMQRLIQTKHKVWISLIVVSFVFSCIATGGWILKNHPYEYIYFNPLFRSYALQNFDLDYWAITEKEVFDYIKANDERNTVKINAYSGHSDYYDDSTMDFVDTEFFKLADYKTNYDRSFDYSFLFDRIMSVNVDGKDIRVLWKRIFTISQEFKISHSANGDVTYPLNGIQWTKIPEGDQLILHGVISENLPAHVIGLISATDTLTEDMSIQFRCADSDWTDFQACDFYEHRPGQISARPASTYVKEFKIILPASYAQKDFQFTIVLSGSLEHNATRSKQGNLIITDLSSSIPNQPGNYPELVFDPYAETSWHTSGQNQGEYLSVSFDSLYEVSSVLLDCSSKPWDYPRNLEIQFSKDGIEWISVDTVSHDTMLYEFSSPVYCKYLRFILGENKDNTSSDWTVEQLEINHTLR